MRNSRLLKRFGFIVTLLFLSVNGFRLQPFVDKLFFGSKEPEPDLIEVPQDFASIKIPEAKAPVKVQAKNVQTDFCTRISYRLSSIHYRECMAVNLRPTGYYSALGEPILVSHFGKVDGVTPTGRVLLIGGTHGDELSSVSIVFEWIKFLRSYHDGEFVWNVVPVMNPDGLFIDEPTRTNANGVDLNRNMPTSDWQRSALAYWLDRAKSSPRKFPGFSAASEPETRWLVHQIDQFQPDMIIAVHAPYNLIGYDAPSRKNAPRRFGQLSSGMLGNYPGSLGNYAGIKRGIPVVTIELPSANTSISVAQAHNMWSDMLEWLENTIPLENQRFVESRHYAELERS
jgi:protein MpaA